MASLLELPDIFRDYLASCPFTADEYKAILDMPEERYVRIRDSSLDPTVIAENLSCSIEEVLEVQWLKEFCRTTLEASAVSCARDGQHPKKRPL